MDSGIDTGGIILQKEITIKKEDTAYSLYHKLIGVFSSNFVRLLIC
jgi:methionyl-tRNA formyltransferase